MIRASQNPFPCTPAIVTVGGESSQWFQDYATYSGVAITVPAGFNGSVRNMDNPQAEVLFSIVGTSLTVTDGADNGDKLNIFGIY